MRTVTRSAAEYQSPINAPLLCHAGLATLKSYTRWDRYLPQNSVPEGKTPDILYGNKKRAPKLGPFTKVAVKESLLVRLVIPGVEVRTVVRRISSMEAIGYQFILIFVFPTAANVQHYVRGVCSLPNADPHLVI